MAVSAEALDLADADTLLFADDNVLTLCTRFWLASLPAANVVRAGVKCAGGRVLESCRTCAGGASTQVLPFGRGILVVREGGTQVLPLGWCFGAGS